MGPPNERPGPIPSVVRDYIIPLPVRGGHALRLNKGKRQARPAATNSASTSAPWKTWRLRRSPGLMSNALSPGSSFVRLPYFVIDPVRPTPSSGHITLISKTLSSRSWYPPLDPSLVQGLTDGQPIDLTTRDTPANTEDMAPKKDTTQCKDKRGNSSIEVRNLVFSRLCPSRAHIHRIMRYQRQL